MIGINNTISVERMTESGGKSEFSGNFIIQNLNCYLEPLAPEIAMMYGEKYAFNSFKLFCDISDILIGDRITDKDSNIYIVQAIYKFENYEIPSHMEAILVKEI